MPLSSLSFCSLILLLSFNTFPRAHSVNYHHFVSLGPLFASISSVFYNFLHSVLLTMSFVISTFPFEPSVLKTFFPLFTLFFIRYSVHHHISTSSFLIILPWCPLLLTVPFQTHIFRSLNRSLCPEVSDPKSHFKSLEFIFQNLQGNMMMKE
jgi:hypothetical protein